MRHDRPNGSEWVPDRSGAAQREIATVIMTSILMNSPLDNCRLISGRVGFHPPHANSAWSWSRVAWLLPIVLSLSACKSKQEAVVATPPEVEVTTIEQRDVPIYKEWVGTLQGDVNATISAQVSGYVTNRPYAEGSTVTNGQVLFEIDKGAFETALAKAKAALSQAKAAKGKTRLDVIRYTELSKTEAISRQELDNAIQADLAADAQIDGATASVEQAQLNLNWTTIRSPIDGVAGLAKAQVGDLIGPSTGPLTTVSSIDPIRAYFSISEQLIYKTMERRLAEGGDARARPTVLELLLAGGDLYPEKGRIRFNDNRVDVKTGTIEVVGEFPNPKHLLSPGMFARIRALVAVQTNALLVPQRAVAEMQGKYLVAHVGSDNKVAIRPVTVGERVGPRWIIHSKDLKAGDQVVDEGIQKVRDGAAITPKAAGSTEKVAAAAEAPAEGAKH
jgi:membrane fusion protein, multidrug efflux system